MNSSRRHALRSLALSTTALASGASSVIASEAFARQAPSTRQFSAQPSSPRSSSARTSAKKSKLVKPKALEPGMTIGVACPAGWTQMANLELGKAALESLGFKVVFGELAGKQYGYLSGTDKERATEFMGLATRKDIDAVICARGGYGIMRLLPLLDYTALANNPKVICGYSDITALINTIYQRCGFVCFHGPGASGTPDEFTVKGLSAVAFTDNERRAKIQSEGFTPIVIDAPNGFETISGGKVRGRLVGGNLTLLAHLTGTPFQVSTKPESTREKTGKILFFEDVTEQPYRIDRMLTQLLIAGTLQQCAGIAIGQFTRCEPEDPAHSFTVAEVLKDRLADLGIPVVSGLQFGHVAKQYTLPLGVMAELDADAGTLSLLEQAVQM